MTYVLGTLGATGAPPRLQFTVQNDGLASLAAAYGTTPQVIWDMQAQGGGAGLRMERVPVQNFTKSRPGWTREEGLFPFFATRTLPNGQPDPKPNPTTVGPDGRPEGYAHFTANTQLMLPDMDRLDGKHPRDNRPAPGEGDDGVSEAGMGVGAVVFAIAAIALLALGKKKKKGSPAPVKF